jgi:hypothetical protein
MVRNKPVDLMPEVERVERLVREGKAGFHCRPAMLDKVRAVWPVPVYCVNKVGGDPVPCPAVWVADDWAADPDGNTPEELGFIEALRSTDLPPGSFFVMVVPLSGPEYGSGYAWKLCEPEGQER